MGVIIGTVLGCLIAMYVVFSHWFSQKKWDQEIDEAEKRWEEKVKYHKDNNLPPPFPPGRIIKEGLYGYKKDIR